MEWTKEAIDVLGIAWNNGLSAAATGRDDRSMASFLELMRRADRVVMQNGLDADCRQLAKEGIDTSWLTPKVFDTRLAAHTVSGHLAGTGSFDLRSLVLLFGARHGQRFPLDFKQYENDLYRTCSMDAAACLWITPTLDRLITAGHLQNTIEIAHKCQPILTLMREQGVRLDRAVLEQIYTARKESVLSTIEKYQLFEMRGKKVIKKVPIWRSNKVLDICAEQFGIRPKDRKRATWLKLASDRSLSLEAKEFVDAIVTLGRGANDAHWLGQANETEDGIDFSKVRSDGMVFPRYDLCGSPDRAIASNPNCFDAVTEVLTKRGWCKWSDVNDSDKLANFYPDTHDIVFEYPLKLISWHFSGNMVEIRTEKHISLLVTPGHDCLLQDRRDLTWHKISANLYPSDMRQYGAGVINQAGTHHDPFTIILIAAMQADGHLRKDCNAIEFTFSKTRKIERLRSALLSAGISFSEATKRCGAKNGVRFYISKPPEWLTKKHFRDHCILDWDTQSIQLLSEELFFWGGCWSRKSHYSSSIEDDADWAQIIVILSGKRARKRTYRQTNWQIDTGNNAWFLTTNATVTPVPYEGLVYCATMPAGTVIVRREGRVAITGQCQNFPRPSEDPRPVPLRQAVIPLDESHVILGVDFSSVETITNAYESQDMDRVRAVLAKRVTHEGTAKLMNDAFGLSLTRQQGKAINHAFDKGESPWNVACRIFQTERPSRHQTGQCQAIYAKMLAEFPKTSKFRDTLWERSVENPLTVTNSFGRRLMCFSRSKYGDASERYAKHVPEKKYWCTCAACGPRRDRWKYAIAFLGRSAAFDALLRKMATIWYEKRLDQYSLPYLEVHDELDYSIPRSIIDRSAQCLVECFEEPIAELGGIRLPADAKWGNNWASAH